MQPLERAARGEGKGAHARGRERERVCVIERALEYNWIQRFVPRSRLWGRSALAELSLGQDGLPVL